MIPHDPPTGDQWSHAEFMELYTQFRTRQLQRQDWIPFNRIANWIAREEGTGRIDDERLTDAYRDLLSGLRQGEFDRGGQCTDHYLGFDEKEYDARLAGPWLIEVVDGFLKIGADFRQVLVRPYLVPCWVPRDLLLKWCENHKYRPRPDWIEVPELEARKTKRRRGPPLKHNWGAIKKETFRLLKNEGMPDAEVPPGWKHITDLEEALKDYCDDKKWHVPAHSSLFPKIKKWIDEYQASVGN